MKVVLTAKTQKWARSGLMSRLTFSERKVSQRQTPQLSQQLSEPKQTRPNSLTRPEEAFKSNASGKISFFRKAKKGTRQKVFQIPEPFKLKSKEKRKGNRKHM